MEEWKEIPGFEGKYSVSSEGKIYSFLTNRLLKPSKCKKGYLSLSLRKNGKDNTFRVHRLVALAFIPNPEGKETINHINTIKDDNRVENLEWNTVEENNDHAYASGLHKNFMVSVIRTNLETGEEKYFRSISNAARDLYPERPSSMLNHPKDRIMRVLIGRQKKYKGYSFRYGD